MKAVRRIGALALLALLIAAWATRGWWAPPERHHGDVRHIADGDSFVLAGQKIRLAGIDAPEYRQSCTDAAGRTWGCGRAARSALAVRLARGPVTCLVEARDRYDRAIATCRTAAGDVGDDVVRAGWAISPSERGAARYADAQSEARAARRGIWAGSFDPPAQWRTSHPQLLTMGE